MHTDTLSERSIRSVIIEYGNAPRLTGRRRTCEGQAQAPPPILDGFNFVFHFVFHHPRCSPDGKPHPAWYFSQPAFTALPLAMLSSGYLMPMSGDNDAAALS
jgi:hypothetical protein